MSRQETPIPGGSGPSADVPEQLLLPGLEQSYAVCCPVCGTVDPRPVSEVRGGRLRVWLQCVACQTLWRP